MFQGNLRLFAHWIAPWWRALLDVVYPRTCRVCDKPLPERMPSRPLSEWFCLGCEDNLSRLEAPYCKVCAEPYEGAIEGAFRCGNCADRKFAFEFAVAGFCAEGAVRELVHRFKYGRDVSLRGALGDLLLAAFQDPRLQEEDFSTWRLVPVPLHRAREQEREFNQSLELCRRLSKQTRIAVVDAIQRRRPTNKQARLTRAQRLENLRGAFAMKRLFRGPASRLRGMNVLLVDDVFTTGATTDACARVLRRQAGVQKVVVIAVARG